MSDDETNQNKSIDLKDERIKELETYLDDCKEEISLIYNILVSEGLGAKHRLRLERIWERPHERKQRIATLEKALLDYSEMGDFYAYPAKHQCLSGYELMPGDKTRYRFSIGIQAIQNQEKHKDLIAEIKGKMG